MYIHSGAPPPDGRHVHLNFLAATVNGRWMCGCMWWVPADTARGTVVHANHCPTHPVPKKMEPRMSSVWRAWQVERACSRAPPRTPTDVLDKLRMVQLRSGEP